MTESIVKSDAAALVPTKAELEGAPLVDTGARAGDRASFPYVGWYGGKTRDTEALDAAGIECGTFYLHDGEPIQVAPFEMHLLRVGRFYTLVDDNGRPVEARLDDAKFDDGFRDHLFFAALVRRTTKAGVRFTPAVGTLRAAQTHALDAAIRLLPRAADPVSWAERSDRHAESAHAKLPGGRFITTIWSAEEKTNGGRVMNRGYGSVRPTPHDQVDALNEYYADNLPLIQAVVGVNNARIAKCQEMLR